MIDDNLTMVPDAPDAEEVALGANGVLQSQRV